MARQNPNSGSLKRLQNHPYYDRHLGERDELIAAGLAKPDWFPTGAQRARRGVKRTFAIVTELSRSTTYSRRQLHVELHDRRNGRWELRIPVSEQEERRRIEAAHRRCQEADRARELAAMRKAAAAESEREARIARLIRGLPPFVPGSMSQAERHQMRILRGLSEQRREIVMGLLERLLDDKAVSVDYDVRIGDEGTHSEAVDQKRGLRLVVDND
jgi:hypothetical protein